MEEIFKNSKRIHDNFYLNEKFVVKESFKFLLNEIKNIQKEFNQIKQNISNDKFQAPLNSVYPNIKYGL